jgi:hypothetical protein
VIPIAFLQAWSTKAPWPDLRQVEQDLIIGRALCDLFNAPALAGKIAFRGGTAIHKLLFNQPLRYSEDIDLVQAHPEPIGGTVDAIRAADVIAALKDSPGRGGEHGDRGHNLAVYVVKGSARQQRTPLCDGRRRRGGQQVQAGAVVRGRRGR